MLFHLMKKKSFLWAVGLLATLLVSSCTQGQQQVKDSEAKDKAVSTVSFTIGLPTGEPVEYRAIHDAPEWAIHSLYMYEFDAAGKLLSAPVDIKASLTGTGPEYGYEYQVTQAQFGVRRFLFIANEPVPAGIVAGSTLADLEGKLAQRTLNGNSKTIVENPAVPNEVSIPMTGWAESAGNPNISVVGTGLNVTVHLTRIVARLDVENKVPNLVIKNLILYNTANQSYLLPNMANGAPTYNVPAGVLYLNAQQGFATLPAPFDYGKSLPKAFYMYEQHQRSKNEALSIKVEATLDGKDVMYFIPFWKDGAEVITKRNHLYRLVFGDDKPVSPNTKVNFTIEDEPWNAILMNEFVGVLNGTYADGQAGTYSKAGHKLSVDNAQHDGLTFSFTTEFASHTAFVATVTAGADFVTATVDGAQVKLNIAANTTGKEREAGIKVVSNADPNTAFLIHVVQAA